MHALRKVNYTIGQILQYYEINILASVTLA